MLEALRARLGLFVLAVVATVGAAIGASLVLPEIYRATATVLVAEPAPGGGFVAPQERLAYMQTQADIVASDRVARRALQAPPIPAGANPTDSTPHNRAGAAAAVSIEGLLTELNVDTAQSNVIRISYDAPDPTRAAATANAFARAFVEMTSELRAENARQSQQLFDEKLGKLGSELQRAEAELTDFQSANAIVAIGEGADPEQALLAELSSQLAKAREQALQLAGRQHQARESALSGAALDRLPDVLADAQIQRLSQDVAQGEAKLQELALQYGVEYPSYQRQAAENRSRRAALQAQARKVVAAVDHLAEQERRRVSGLEAAVAAQRAKMLERITRRNELTRLARQVETARRAYDAAQARFVVDVAERRAALPQVSVLSEAVLPRRPHHPKLALNVAVALIVGLVLGLAAITALEMADRRVRVATDLRLGSPPPLLGVLSPWSPAPAMLTGRSRGLPELPSSRF